MDVKLSSKYQIVIPKDVRRQLGLKSGQKMHISEVTSTGITLSKQPTAEEYVERYAGTLTNTPWQKAGIDAAIWLRQNRDQDR
jgi:AbrB family looped-hinge helix DNA binding protein